jgi:hypothetical protein
MWHYLFLYGTLELFRQCGIIGFYMGLWNCSDSVALFVFILDFGTIPRVRHYLFFLLDFGNVPTVWHHLLFNWTLELFREFGNIGFSFLCAIICFSIRIWNCSDSVTLFVFIFLLDVGTVPTL